MAVLAFAGPMMMGSSGASCNPDRPNYEFVVSDDQTGDSASYLALYGGHQYESPTGRLETLPGRLSDVETELPNRFVPFMLTGDVREGSPISSLQLPPALIPGERRSIDVRSNGEESYPKEWSSFRIYDTGQCSARISWRQLGEQLTGAIIDQISEDERSVGDVVARWATLEPTLVSSDPDNVLQPGVENSTLHYRGRIRVDRFDFEGDGGGLGCNDVRMTIDVELRPRLTDHAYFQFGRGAVAAACVLGADIRRTSEYYEGRDKDDPTQEEDFPKRLFREACIQGGGDCNLSDPARVSDSERSRLRGELQAWLELMEEGQPTPECDPRARLGGMDVSQNVDFIRLSTLSTRSNKHQHRYLLGFDELNGVPADAHDLLGQVVRVSTDGNFKADGCFGFTRRFIQDSVRNNVRNAVPLILRDTILETLTLDPFVWDSAFANLPPGNGRIPLTRECDANACRALEEREPLDRYTQCGFLSPDGPVAAGGRHYCRGRNTARLTSLAGDNPPSTLSLFADAINAEEMRQVCHVALEPQWFNIRPDGIEIVLADNISTEMQSALLANPLVDAIACGESRSGRLDIESDPVLINEDIINVDVDAANEVSEPVDPEILCGPGYRR